MNGALAAKDVSSINISNIAAHKHESEDEEFHLILDSISDKSVRNQVYKDVVSLVNELNSPAGSGNYGNHTLSSIALPDRKEILAIGGVTASNFDNVSRRIMNIMQQKGYSAGQNQYAAQEAITA